MARTSYGQLPGERWGRAILDGIIHQLGEALKNAPLIETPMNTSGALLGAMDKATAELDPDGDIFMVMEGDWSEVTIDLAAEGAEEFEPHWRIPDPHQDEIGRYRGWPIFIRYSQGRRHLYIVEHKRWGRFVRKQFGGDQDLFMEIGSISEERARELLKENPLHFSEEPDEASKLRKLRTHLEVVVRTRYEFQVDEPTRARHVVEA